MGLGFAAGGGVVFAGVVTAGVGSGAGCCGGVVCGCSWPCCGSIGLEASRLSLLAPAGVFCAAFCPQPAATSRARMASEGMERRRMAIGDPPVRYRLPCRACGRYEDGCGCAFR